MWVHLQLHECYPSEIAELLPLIWTKSCFEGRRPSLGLLDFHNICSPRTVSNPSNHFPEGNMKVDPEKTPLIDRLVNSFHNQLFYLWTCDPLIKEHCADKSFIVEFIIYGWSYIVFKTWVWVNSFFSKHIILNVSVLVQGHFQWVLS